MKVRDATDEDIRFVAQMLRPADEHEQFAMRFDDDPDRLAEDVIAWRRVALRQLALCCDDGEPATIVGAYLTGPITARFHMMSTARLGEITSQGHRFARRVFIPTVLAQNVVLAEARILADHSEALRWTAACGFEQIAILPGGKHGEKFALVVWRHPVEELLRSEKEH